MIERTVAAYRVNSSAIAVALLVVTNLIPLVGVLWLGWDLMLILALYWAENGVVGVINILKILTAEGDELQSLDHALVGERPPGGLTQSPRHGRLLHHPLRPVLGRPRRVRVHVHPGHDRDRLAPGGQPGDPFARASRAWTCRCSRSAWWAWPSATGCRSG